MAVILQEYYLACLSHASYLIASEGEAAIVDPQRDVDIYIDAARDQGLDIKYVIETHLHADFVSGHRELADRTGATIMLGAKAGATFPHTPARDGDEVRFGHCVLRFLETPGHTEESICVLVTDTDRSSEPFAVLTGDTLFIGDVGRPDLSPSLSPRELAGMLYDSLHSKLMTLDDSVQVYPAHGAGSLCGRRMSNEKKSTIGIQRRTNYALQARSREEFVELLTAEMPERPKYFAQDAELNRSGAAPISALAAAPVLPAVEVARLQREGAIVLDTRPASEFGGAHIPGSIQIGLAGQFASWAGALIDLNSRVVLVAEDEEKAAESRLRLARVGIEGVAGSMDGGITGWVRAKMPVAQIAQISAQELHEMRHDPELQIVDVRQGQERRDGFVEGSLSRPLAHLTAELQALDRRKPVAVYCKGGYRSAIAASLLQAAGFEQVLNVTGGFDAWTTCGLPVAPQAIIGRA